MKAKRKIVCEGCAHVARVFDTKNEYRQATNFYLSHDGILVGVCSIHVWAHLTFKGMYEPITEEEYLRRKKLQALT